MIHGLKINKTSSFVSHLLFVVDSLLFFTASKDEGVAAKEILHSYELVLRQKINFQKSTLLVSSGTNHEIFEGLNNLFEVEMVSCHA